MNSDCRAGSKGAGPDDLFSSGEFREEKEQKPVFYFRQAFQSVWDVMNIDGLSLNTFFYKVFIIQSSINQSAEE